MNESTPSRRHQHHCAHPDPAHDGGCPLFWDAPPTQPDGSSTAPARLEDPWSEPQESADAVGILDYHNNPVPVLLDERGRWVSVPALSGAMGIDGNAQRQNLVRRPWSEGWTCIRHVQLPGSTQRRPVFFIHEDRVPMWLGNIDAARIRDPQARARVEATQVEFADVLAEYAATGQVRAKVEPSSPSVTDLVHRSDLSNAEWFALLGQALDRAKGEAAARVEAEERVAELEPAAATTAAFVAQEGEFSVGAVAKMVGTGRVRLFATLRTAGVFITGGRLHNTPYQRYIERGLFRVAPSAFVYEDGAEAESYTTLVTPKGVDFIWRLVAVQS